MWVNIQRITRAPHCANVVWPDLEQARPELDTAIALYHAMDMTFWLPQADAALAQVV